MNAETESSYRACRRLARERARNFYYAFWLFPVPKRDAFCAIYAFMRQCDDVADGDASVEEKRFQLSQWRQALDWALEGNYSYHWLFPAFHDAVRRYQIPRHYFQELIAGAEMDLCVRSYATFADLYRYCYRVASVVGLCSLQIMGYKDAAAPELAEQCGIAFQLTNILRDLVSDARAGRVYLPEEDFLRFGCSPEQILRGAKEAQFQLFMDFQIRRARSFYERSAPLVEMVEEDSRPALWTLISIYRSILERIAQSQGRALRPVALSEMEKIAIVLQAAGMQLRGLVGGQPDWRVAG